MGCGGVSCGVCVGWCWGVGGSPSLGGGGGGGGGAETTGKIRQIEVTEKSLFYNIRVT